MDSYVELANTLRTNLWRTAGARFYAARRLELRDRLSTFSIAFLSVIAIGIGLLDPVLGQGNAPSLLRISAAVLTAIISVFVLVISLIEGNGRSQLQATRLHENGVKLAELRGTLELLIAKSLETGVPAWDGLERLRKEYDGELRECPFNHEPIDAQRFKIDHRKSKEFIDFDNRPEIGWLHAMGIETSYLTSAAWLAAISWVVVVGLVAAAVDWRHLT